MDPELNQDEQPRDLNEAEQAAVDAAFSAGFTGASGVTTETEEEVSLERTPAAAAPAPAPAPAPAAPAPAPVDPYAGLPEPVREALGRVTQMEINLRQATGRVSALQSEVARLSKAPAAAPTPAPAPAAPENPALERVRGELPEVADAIEEVLRQRTAAPAPAPASAPAPAAPDTEAALNATMNEVYPGWDQKLSSTEFALWLGRQPREVQDTMATTSDIGTVVKHLRVFDSFQDGAKRSADAAQAEAERKAGRLRSNATPSGARRAPVAATQTEDEALIAGFNSARGRTG